MKTLLVQVGEIKIKLKKKDFVSRCPILFSKLDMKSVGHLETKSFFFNFILISPTCTSNVFKKLSPVKEPVLLYIYIILFFLTQCAVGFKNKLL